MIIKLEAHTRPHTDTSHAYRTDLPSQPHLVSPHVRVLYRKDGVRHEDVAQVPNGGVSLRTRSVSIVTRGGTFARLHRPVEHQTHFGIGSGVR